MNLRFESLFKENTFKGSKSGVIELDLPESYKFDDIYMFLILDKRLRIKWKML